MRVSSHSAQFHYPWLRLLAAGVLVLGAIVAIRIFGVSSDVDTLLSRLRDMGAWAPLFFIALYVAVCVTMLPAVLLTLAAGALFGVALGTVYVSVASTLGATAAFLIGRYIARGWVAGAIAQRPAFLAIDEAVAMEGWKIVGLTRLSPVFPFGIINYVYGLTRVRLRDYVWASWLGMLPVTMLYVYMGSAAGHITSTSASARTPAAWAMFAAGLVATIAVTAIITRTARRMLREKVKAI
jgi:uncharacterized membrane protein YdjX (TVP38/TMEM64 family)